MGDVLARPFVLIPLVIVMTIMDHLGLAQIMMSLVVLLRNLIVGISLDLRIQISDTLSAIKD